MAGSMGHWNSQSITWASEGISGNVLIEYSTDNGTSWTDIIAGTPDVGFSTWPIPDIYSRMPGSHNGYGW